MFLVLEYLEDNGEGCQPGKPDLLEELEEDFLDVVGRGMGDVLIGRDHHVLGDLVQAVDEAVDRIHRRHEGHLVGFFYLGKVERIRTRPLRIKVKFEPEPLFSNLGIAKPRLELVIAELIIKSSTTENTKVS